MVLEKQDIKGDPDNMKKRIALLILAALAASPMAALAAEGFVYADVLSAYVFNGQVGNDEAVFQPGVDVTGPLGFGFNLWANMNLTDNDAVWGPDTAGKWSEVDPGLFWNVPVKGPVSLTLGALYYIFPQNTSSVELPEDGSEPVVGQHPADGGYEAFVKAKAEDIILAPAIKFAHDMDNQDDWIALFSIGHSFELMDALSLDLTGTLSYSGEYYVESNYGSDAGSAFTHAQLDAVLNYALNEKAAVGLKASYSSIVDGDVRDDIEETDFYPETDIFFGGVTASYSF
jgi:hypothetical protein